MNWHTRYSQQANWTRDLRSYIFEKVGLAQARNVLEVGCGTGAILSQLPKQPDVHGLDINFHSLKECHVHTPDALLNQGNALHLPYRDHAFEIVYSHFLLLWVGEPLKALLEMKRVTAAGGYVIAFAEPNYAGRIDRPEQLVPLGQWQTEALVRQGADPTLGARLAELFFEAGIPIIETGTIQTQGSEMSRGDWELEWEVIESDLQGWVPQADIKNMKSLDRAARQANIRQLHVPTHFAWGRIQK